MNFWFVNKAANLCKLLYISPHNLNAQKLELKERNFVKKKKNFVWSSNVEFWSFTKKENVLCVKPKPLWYSRMVWNYEHYVFVVEWISEGSKVNVTPVTILLI